MLLSIEQPTLFFRSFSVAYPAIGAWSFCDQADLEIKRRADHNVLFFVQAKSYRDIKGIAVLQDTVPGIVTRCLSR